PITAGSSQGRTFTMRSTSSNIAEADILSGSAGAQDARFTITKSLTWYAAAAVFKPTSSTADTTPPSVPAGLTATNGSGSVGLSGYTVYRNGSVLGTVGGSVLSYADNTVSPSTTYTYTVDAFDAAGIHSGLSQAVTVTTLGQADTTPPTVPAGLAATAGPAGEVDLSWTASTDDVGVAGYTVYRDGSSIGTVGGSATSFADKAVSSATTYAYTV